MQATRRRFLALTGGLGAVVALPALAVRAATRPKAVVTKPPSPRLSASEHLLREHGVLDRILLIYEEGSARLRAKHDVDPDVFRRAAELARIFVEDYHDRLEQDVIFPELERRGVLVELLAVLRAQHEAARGLTDAILRASEPQRYADLESRADLLLSCDAMLRMARPHAAHENTAVFPALARLLTPSELDGLSERFERQAEELLPRDGFDLAVEQLTSIEKHFDLDRLERFSPGV